MDHATRRQTAKSLRAAAAALMGAAASTPAALIDKLKSALEKKGVTDLRVDERTYGGTPTITLKAGRTVLVSITTYPQPDGSRLVDTKLDPQSQSYYRSKEWRGELPKQKDLLDALLAHGAKAWPTLIPMDLSVKPVVDSVEVSSDTFDEWVSLVVTVKGKWRWDSRDVTLSPEERAWAEALWKKVLPEARKQAEKYAGKTRLVEPDGAGGWGEADKVHRAVPKLPTNFADVEVSISENQATFSISDREE